MKGALIVRVKGGLCNRMRALLTAAYLTGLSDYHLSYGWPTSAKFEAELQDLWDVPWTRLPHRVIDLAAKVSGGYTPLGDLEKAIGKRRIVLVRTGDPVVKGPAVPAWYELARDLRPHPAIVERVHRMWSDGWKGRPAVGVMIRANERSHTTTRAASPPQWFYARMAEIRAAHPDVLFFLSTETPEVSRAVHAQFQDVYELRGKAGYNTAQGVRDAVCDLYLLASTNFVVGSHYSSFSELAGHLGGPGRYETAASPASVPLEAMLQLPSSPPIPVN